MSQYLSGPEWRSTMANGRIYWIHRLHLTPAWFLNLFLLISFFKKGWFLLKNVRECDNTMHACTYKGRYLFLEFHSAICQTRFNETMQVDNVSCKCIESFPFRFRAINPSPPNVFNAVRKICYWCGPCSFPCAVGLIDADRAQKHGMDEFISANPCSFDHASLFEMVQRLTLDHRLNDTFCSLVSNDTRIE